MAEPLAQLVAHALIGAMLAMGSPWWEDYDTREVFLCPDRGRVVVERNESQASLLTGRFRSTLFRDQSVSEVVRYRNEQISISLRGDVLTLERTPSRVDCLRTEQV